MKFINRIISLVSVIAIIISAVVAPVFATAALPGSTSAGYAIVRSIWNWAVDDARKNGVSASTYLQHMLSSRSDSGCSYDGGNHAWELSFGNFASGLIAGSWDAVCAKCHVSLSSYLGKESLDTSDLSAAYDEYVSELPAQGISSLGSFSMPFRLADEGRAQYEEYVSKGHILNYTVRDNYLGFYIGSTEKVRISFIA